MLFFSNKSLTNLAKQLDISWISIAANIEPRTKDSKKALKYHKQKYADVLQTLKRLDSKEIKFVLYTTYENPFSVVALSELMRKSGVESYEYNPYEISLYANFPGFENIVGEIAHWPMEEAIYPRITSAENNELINIKECEFDSGAAITFCFGYQRDDIPIAYWVPGLYPWLNRYFLEHGRELVDRLDIPSPDEVICVDPNKPRSLEEYYSAVAKTSVLKLLQKTEIVRERYVELYSLD